MPQEDMLKAVDKILGEPFLGSFTEETSKIRKSLLIASIISIIITTGSINIEVSSSAFGIKLSGLDDNAIKVLLIVIVSYFYLNFIWKSYDAIIEWRLRLTGTRVGFITSAKVGSEYGDYPDDPRQSTLYYWWKRNASELIKITNELYKISVTFEEWKVKIAPRIEENSSENGNYDNLQRSLDNAISNSKKLLELVNSKTKHFTAERVVVSLERFDNWFKLCLRSQNLRWLLIELILPILVGSLALVMLCLNILIPSTR